MKSDFDKEIDALFRWSGRRAVAARSDKAELSPDEQAAASTQIRSHLDADELSAYAENALPAATRTRYAAHLAECEKCRKIVTSIALEANVATELEKRATMQEHVAPVSLWRAWLAQIFTPRVLRFAAPALALLVAGIIAFVVTRTPEEQVFVAQREQSPAIHPTVLTGAGSSEQRTETTSPAVSEVSPSAKTEAQEEKRTAATESARIGITEDKQVGANTNSAPTTAMTDAAPAGAPPPPPPKPEESKPFSPEPKAIDQAASTDERLKIEERAKKDDDSRIARLAEENRSDTPPPVSRSTSPPQQKAEESGVRARETAKDSAGAGPLPDSQMSKARRDPAQGVALSRRRQSAVSESERSEGPAASSETRSIAGRRFRRRGSAWVDTSYNSSQATINVTRGSEQYRALVADEPELRRIAQQLDGEVIVVWKGRAYRIN